jgi:predicted aspartyl protease
MKKVPLQILRINSNGYHLMASLKINGLKANALIDTGASRTILDKSRVAYYLDHPTMKKYDKFFSGLGTGPIETFRTDIGSIEIGGIELRKLEVVVIDLKAINDSYALFDLPKIDLVLGCDLLIKMNAVIDCPNRDLIVNI